MARLELYLFGPPRICLDEQEVEISLQKAVALLAYLAVTRRPHSRDALATLLWPDADQGTALGRLRRTLYRLGQAIGPDFVLTSRTTAEIDPQADLWLDTEQFRELLAGCLSRAGPDPAPEDDCESRLATAVALYGDGFLAGFSLRDSPAFDEWQFFEAESLHRFLGSTLENLAEIHRERGEWERAIDYARHRLALDPLEEASHRRLMRLYAGAGRRSAALRQYDECERILEDELDVAPGKETVALREAIRARRAPALSGQDGPVGPPGTGEPAPDREPVAGAAAGQAPYPSQEVPLRDKSRSWTGYAPDWSDASPTWPPASWSGTRNSD